MSTVADLGSDMIQHIDDACDEEYIEGFAPKAQEEILSETQCNNQINDSNENIVDEIAEKSETIDISNEDIHEASTELVKDIITDVESDINQEDEGIPENEEEEDLEINVDNSLESETNVEIIDADEADVDMKEAEAVVESDTEHEIIDNAEASNELDDNVEDPIVELSNPEEESPIDEPIIEQEEETEEIIVEDEKVEEANEIIEEQLAENSVNSEEIEQEAEVNEVDEIKSEENSENIVNDEVESNENKIGDVVEVKSESNAPKTQMNTLPPKGKDVKSLSSTYGQEENLTNGHCSICNKIVYPMEKLATNDRLFHKTCFRCTKCKNALSAGNFTFNHGKPYCTPHYVELFKKRGRYDEIDDSIEAENATATSDISDVITDELPAPDTTKNILAKFRDLETGSGNNANQSAAIDSTDELPAPNTTKNLMERFSALGQEKTDTKCKPKIDIPRHSNGHSNGTSENEPVVLSKDVVRSNEPSQDDKPEQGITKNLVNQFRKMESSANN